MRLPFRAATPVNGFKLYYEVHGSDTHGKPPLVLLHGGDPTIETFFRKTLRLASPDDRGVPGSTPCVLALPPVATAWEFVSVIYDV